jgi:hypothetical protein
VKKTVYMPLAVMIWCNSKQHVADYLIIFINSRKGMIILCRLREGCLNPAYNCMVKCKELIYTTDFITL